MEYDQPASVQLFLSHEESSQDAPDQLFLLQAAVAFQPSVSAVYAAHGELYQAPARHDLEIHWLQRALTSPTIRCGLEPIPQTA